MTNKDMLLPTGVFGLDTVLGGGLSRPSLVAIIGAPGAGKTVLASQILFHAARRGLKTIIFTSFSEGVEQYIQHMQPLEFFDTAMVGDAVQVFTLASQIRTEDASPDTAIARTIRASGAKVVLLDGFQSVEAQLPADRSVRALLSALATQIRYLDATVLVTIAGDARDAQFHTEMTIADAAIALRYRVQGRRHERLVEIVKLRGRAQ
ncbi:hypothetical protein SE17_17580 [Kouleothrix aurantiaca]|uniref:KaiC-like domain-containing protein n=1 Tax=Kouleothrix aurantiaca TaxID=186479 RepID=A0A0P9CZS2_9CHLR|nr:hypothetical protein SE17_17580 [Kouleothrix aurantiaca]